jgi:hypothetical protein
MLFVRATLDENLEGILRGCPMTGKCAKVMPTSDTFKNSNPEEFHTFIKFFRHSSESLPPLHTEALC